MDDQSTTDRRNDITDNRKIGTQNEMAKPDMKICDRDVLVGGNYVMAKPTDYFSQSIAISPEKKVNYESMKATRVGAKAKWGEYGLKKDFPDFVGCYLWEVVYPTIYWKLCLYPTPNIRIVGEYGTQREMIEKIIKALFKKMYSKDCEIKTECLSPTDSPKDESGTWDRIDLRSIHSRLTEKWDYDGRQDFLEILKHYLLKYQAKKVLINDIRNLILAEWPDNVMGIEESVRNAIAAGKRGHAMFDLTCNEVDFNNQKLWISPNDNDFVPRMIKLLPLQIGNDPKDNPLKESATQQEFLNIDEVATFCRCNKRTIYRWIQKKNFPKHNNRRWDKARITEWLK